MNNWLPTSPEVAFKRAAGRRKLNISRRKARAERVKELLSDMLGVAPRQVATLLRSGAYGATRCAAGGLKVSEATASRDLALCHRLLAEFEGLFEREFSFLLGDEVIWSWDYSSYGFKEDGSKKVVGEFPFSCSTARERKSRQSPT
jgi:hypothetical protein